MSNKNSFTVSAFQFEEQFLQSPEDLEKLRNDGSLMFQQVPMVEIDGMKLAQTRAILNYIATKYNLYGKDIKERALIDMYSEGMADLNEMILHLPLCPPDQKDAKMTQIREKTTNRYFPAFEKVLKSHGQHYLVGNRLSRADIHLVELIYYVEEIDPSLLANFPLLKAPENQDQQPPTCEEVSAARQSEEASHRCKSFRRSQEDFQVLNKAGMDAQYMQVQYLEVVQQ
ncbi:hypothetical protein QTO34_001424 [Cnephaeus nilssonii]|uniref:Glutathione S-transferase n=1 Tax=Cnephaeus nilssonii TaxID=3371016 RepID=A0AA40LNV8_CNENI|nr:hypothetical protein QTO34_001424 [Eptesicus nilssonii]